MNTEKAKQIEGFMSERELETLAGLASKAKVIIEVGSWFGRSARAMADNLPEGGRLIAIDHWHGSIGEDNAHAQAKLMGGDYVYCRFLDNHEDLIGSAKVLPLRGNSESLLRSLYDNGIKADLIFIDAGHTYEEVVTDIGNCIPLLAEGGVLCGHDYCDSWPEVKRAVDEFIPNKGVVAGTSIWFRKTLA